MSITVIEGDLLAQDDLDFIVNAANTHLEHMGGIAGAILRAGGDIIQWESRKKRPVATGNAVITTAGGLPFKGVIHTVGPIWNGGDYEERKLLHLAHMSALMQAHRWAYDNQRADGVRVGFPAVSCGIFGFPVRQAAPIAVNCARQYQPHVLVSEVRFCLLDPEHLAAYQAAHKAEAVLSAPGPGDVEPLV
jgi:putative ATPase